MPQTTRRGVAPLTPQPRRPEGTIAVLRESGARRRPSRTMYPGFAGLSSFTTGRSLLRRELITSRPSCAIQNQALNAVVFLYRTVIRKEIGDFSDFSRAREGLRLPVVASRSEIRVVSPVDTL